MTDNSTNDNKRGRDTEKNRFSARAARYARVGANVGGVAARYAGRRLVGGRADRAGDAQRARRRRSAGSKGPLMKVAQLMATIPDLLPPEYAAELQKLQSEAPPMGWAFVKRRMMAELGAGWEKKFESFEHHPAAAASLGQVHRAALARWRGAGLQAAISRHAVGGRSRSAATAMAARAIRRRFDSAIDTSEIGKEIGARVREELDYRREAKHVALYREMLDGIDIVRVPRAWPELSTGRLLTLDWLDGTQACSTHKNDPLDCAQHARHRDVHRLVVSVQPLRRHPRRPASRQLHGVRRRDGRAPAGINLLDYGCIRIFPPKFVAAWSIFITACCTATTTWWCTPTRPGASASFRAI